MLRSDQHRLRHMLDASREAIGFAANRSRPEIDADRQLLLALVKCIEIVGEAAASVSDDTRALHPEVPWRDAARMRNRLVHAYFDIDADVVWQTVQQDLPQLVGVVEPLLANAGDE